MKNKYILWEQSVISASNLLITEHRLLGDLQATDEQKQAISIICKSHETLYFRVRKVANILEKQAEFKYLAKLMHDILDK